MDSQAAVALVLVGHTEVRRALWLSTREACWQRTSVGYHLRALDLSETGAYIQHQVKVSGYLKGVLFRDGLVAKAYDHALGISRQIRLVCTHAPMVGCAEHKRVLDETVLRQVLSDPETAT
jgi:general secretion pathway protein A